MLPVLDVLVFTTLVRELASYPDALNFVASFNSLLPTRITRIDRALTDRDRQETLTALLSPQASAAIAGAAQLHATTTKALSNQPVENLAPEPLIRQLRTEAALFSQAFESLDPCS